MQKINGLRKLFMLFVCLGALPGFIQAQDSDLRPVTTKYAIKNATIVQAPGRIISKGTVVFENGVIKSVGANVSIPKDALVIDADSMYVYAGFISGMSNIGVPKPKEERERPDRKLRANPPYELAGITPEASVTDMLSADDKSVEEYRQLGFTAAHAVPHNGMLSGTSALILLGGSSSSMVIQPNFTMYSQLTGAGGVYPNTVIGVMAKYRDMYRKAQQAMDYESKYKANSAGMARPATDLTLAALYPVVKKQMPVSFEANEILDVMRVLTLKNDLGFNLMLGEVKQSWDAIDKIKAANASLFLSLDLPELKEEKKEEKKDDKADAKEGEEKKEEAKKEEKPKEKTAADLEKEALEKRQKEMITKYYAQASMINSKGIKFGFSTLDSKSKDFKATMNNIIKNGLPEDQALAALTVYPAEILGLSSKMGTIDNGKMANLIVSDKPYFDEKSNVRYVFVDGVLYEYEVKKEKKKKSGGEAVKPNGAWNYTSSTPQGEGTGVITITGSEGSYSGTMTLSFNDSSNDIENLEVDGNNVTFSITIDAGGQQMTMDVTMTIDGDSFEGTMTVAQFGSFPLSGSKSPENN